MGLGKGSESFGRKDWDSGGRKCCWGGGSGFCPAVEDAGCTAGSVVSEEVLAWAGWGLVGGAGCEDASSSVASAQESF